VQHRDGRPPWCRECGLDATGRAPASRLPGQRPPTAASQPVTADAVVTTGDAAPRVPPVTFLEPPPAPQPPEEDTP